MQVHTAAMEGAMPARRDSFDDKQMTISLHARDGGSATRVCARSSDCLQTSPMNVSGANALFWSPMRITKLAWGMLAIGMWAVGPQNLCAQRQAIDASRSNLTVRVFKSGMFSAFAHDHEIQAPIDGGEINSSANRSVQLRIDARKMRVLDPEISASSRADIQNTMEGAEVLDVEHFPKISYDSTGITKTGDGHWEVRGNLNLHGRSKAVVVMVALQNGHYRGSASFRQSQFGITPIRIAAGTVKVKDEVKIEFDIVPVS